MDKVKTEDGAAPPAIDENPEEAETEIEGDLEEMDIDLPELPAQDAAEKKEEDVSSSGSSKAESEKSSGEISELSEVRDHVDDDNENDKPKAELGNLDSESHERPDTDKAGGDQEKEDGEIDSTDEAQPSQAPVQPNLKEDLLEEYVAGKDSKDTSKITETEKQEEPAEQEPEDEEHEQDDDELEQEDEEREESGEPEEPEKSKEEVEELDEGEEVNDGGDEDEAGIDADGEDEADADDDGSPNKSKRKREVEEDDTEERAIKRKAAVSSLTEIEVEFARLRDRLREDKIARLQAEIEMCRDGTHPELSTVYDQISQARDERIKLADTHRMYRRRCIENQTRAYRTHIHQQFFKNTSNLRAKMITETTERWYKVNRERRAMDSLAPFYGYKIPEKRIVQYRHRQAQYNEIAILVGLAKYVGFPAAPEIMSATTEEVAEDMEALRAARVTA